MEISATGGATGTLATQRGHWRPKTRAQRDLGGRGQWYRRRGGDTGDAAGTLAAKDSRLETTSSPCGRRSLTRLPLAVYFFVWTVYCVTDPVTLVYIYIYIGHGLHTVSDQRVCMCEYGYIHMYVRVDVCTASCMYGLNQYPAYLNIQVCTCKHRSINSHIDKKMYMWFMFACGRLYIYTYIRRCTCA